MSTLTVSNVSDGSLSIPTTYVTNGSAKAWVSVNAISGTPSINDSLNISSITDNAAGRYYVNMSSSFANANYSTSGSTGLNSGVYCGAMHIHGQNNTSANIYVNSSQFGVQTVNSGFTLVDFTYWGTQSFGELA